MKIMMYVAYAINKFTKQEIRLGCWRLPETAWWNINNNLEYDPEDNPYNWTFKVVEELVEVEEI